MHSITAQQLITVRSVVSEAKQHLDGNGQIRAIALYEIADDAYALDVRTWPNAKLALTKIVSKLHDKHIDCTLQPLPENTNAYRCIYTLKP